MSRKRPRFQFRLRALFALTAIAAVLLAVPATCDRVVRELASDVAREFVGETGPVPSREDWPEPLKAVLADWKEGELDPATIQVHCLCQGFDPEYVWRMDAAPGLFEQLAERWELTEISRPDWPVRKGRSSFASKISGAATPEWWSPKEDADTTFYECPQTLARDKGHRYWVALDKKQGAIFVHYWFNF